jgi:F-type H+-transporting ATPase subunit O
LRNFATSSGVNDQKKVKVPLVLFGNHGKYCSSLYIVAVKANILDKVEAELSAIVAASKNGPTFSQFLRDPTVSKDIRVKAIQDIATAAKFTNITNNFLAVLAADGLLKDIESITQKFKTLTMAHRGEVKATVTTVIPLPAEEEKELKETLQYILGAGKKVLVEQKIDASILGGLVVEFDQKVFDMSIKTRAQQMERFLREPINSGSI